MKFVAAIFGIVFTLFLNSTPSNCLMCLSGPSLGPNLEEETPPREVNCSNEKPLCIRVDATLYRSTVSNSGKISFKVLK